MKTNMLTLASAAALTMSLALPVYAATTSVSDEALDAIAGKDNLSSTTGTDSTTITGSTLNGNIQVGYYQWADEHGADGSTNKGGNIQSGSDSMVQQNAAVEANTLAWGAVAQSVTTNTSSTIGSNQAMESWATLYVGGF
jgi:hypothetical protein